MIACRFLLLLFCLALPAEAHSPSDGFIHVEDRGGQLAGRIDLAIRDLDFIFDLDANRDLQVTWGELKARQEDIQHYLQGKIELRQAGEKVCPLSFSPMQVMKYSDGTYGSFAFHSTCVSPVTMTYEAFFAFDASHRGLLRWESAGKQISHVFSVDEPHFTIDLAQQNPSASFATFVREGMWHIFTGYDHMLFLLALLLPAVMQRRAGRWVARHDLRVAAFETAKVVTSFTAAHSLTLTLVTLKLFIPPPAVWVETGIAATILFTAVNNLTGWVSTRQWLLGFFFGLIHGIGFASVLTELGLAGKALFVALIGFNGGVELAQLVILSLFLPLQFFLRETLFYRRLILQVGSVVVGVLAIGWMLDQVAGLSLMPF